MAGDGINIEREKYPECRFCGGIDTLNITGEAYCSEYGSCDSDLEVCMKCIQKVLNGEAVIVRSRLVMADATIIPKRMSREELIKKVEGIWEKSKWLHEFYEISTTLPGLIDALLKEVRSED